MTSESAVPRALARVVCLVVLVGGFVGPALTSQAADGALPMGLIMRSGDVDLGGLSGKDADMLRRVQDARAGGAGLSDADRSRIAAGLREQRDGLLQPEADGDGIGPGPQDSDAPQDHVADSSQSQLERMLAGVIPSGVSVELTQYGYAFFNGGAPSFAPDQNVPVGPDYVVGPGDNFKVYLWGKVENSYDLTVSRNGEVTIPKLGPIAVSGLSLANVKQLLAKRFKAFYPEFELSITMGRLRTIQIFVVGEARSPGTYSVSSLSTVVTALFAAGGPSKIGSMRSIRLVRDGETAKTIDLYDFFLKGSKRQDERLRPGDTLFIPVIGPVVGVAGNVRRPAIYEARKSCTVGEALQVAGGVLPVASLQNIVVERAEQHARRIVMNFNVDAEGNGPEKALGTPLLDGDLVKVYPIHKAVKNVVYLEGHVKYPREYEFKKGMRLRNLIPSFDSLLPEPYLPQAEIRRLVPPELRPEVVSFDLGALLKGDQDQNIALHDLDRVVIHHRWDKEIAPQVRIGGQVRNPGPFRLHDGLRIKDLIYQAGGFTEKAAADRGTVCRIVQGRDGMDMIEIDFAPARAVAGLSPDNVLLKPDDAVYVRGIPDYGEALTRSVRLDGEFRFPGEYSFTEGERLSSVIERAGGLTDKAFPFGAVFFREAVKSVQEKRLKDYVDRLEEEVLTLGGQAAGTATDSSEALILMRALTSKKALLEKMRTATATGRMVIDLNVIVSGGSAGDFELRPGDRLVVRKKPDFVSILGEVYNPTALLAKGDMSLKHALRQVGGVTDNAEEDNIYVVRANGEVLSKESYTGLLSSAKVGPGDTVIVPKKIETYAGMRLTKDITEILFRIAVAAGVVIAAF